MEMVGSTPPQYYPYTQLMPAVLKHYELNDHLGNVNTVVSGKLLPGNGAGSAYQADVVSAQSYEAFGSLLPNRNWDSNRYLWGFGSHIKDDEMHGSTGTSYDFGARIYDPRVARWLGMDPFSKEYPGLSPYSFAANMPIIAIDRDGKKISFGWQTTEKAIERFKAVLQHEFAGKVEVRVVDGVLTLHHNEKLELTQKEKVLYDKLNIVIGDPKNVEIDVVENKSDVLTGSFASAYDDERGPFAKNVLDIEDIAKCVSSDATPGATILHEVWESYLAQAKGVKGESHEATYLLVHAEAEKQEGAVSGITINGGMSFTDAAGNGLGYTNFSDKDGNKQHYEVTYENGNVTGFSQKAGHVDLSEKQREYEQK